MRKEFFLRAWHLKKCLHSKITPTRAWRRRYLSRWRNFSSIHNKALQREEKRMEIPMSRCCLFVHTWLLCQKLIMIVHRRRWGEKIFHLCVFDMLFTTYSSAHKAYYYVCFSCAYYRKRKTMALFHFSCFPHSWLQGILSLSYRY